MKAMVVFEDKIDSDGADAVLVYTENSEVDNPTPAQKEAQRIFEIHVLESLKEEIGRLAEK